jgi:hypothetical protein
MNGGKFAAMTANLLARKGDAAPSALPEMKRVFSLGALSAPPPVHRVFETVEPALTVPPPDMRTVERSAHIPPPSPPVMRVVEKVREPAHIDKPRRLFVNVTPDEYERLGILGVKRDATRHQLLRAALDAFLKVAARDCACLSGEGCKNNCEA